MSGNSKRENREIPTTFDFCESERSANATGGTADAYVVGKSDGSVVPAKPANNGGALPPAEPAEERDPAKRNADQDALRRTPCRTKRRSRGLAGVREAAREDGQLKLTALLHHVNEDCLVEAFFNLKKTAAVGVDKVTWQQFVDEVRKLWFHSLRRRSEKGKQRWNWERMNRLANHHLPRPRILHPYPEERFRARLKAGAV